MQPIQKSLIQERCLTRKTQKRNQHAGQVGHRATPNPINMNAAMGWNAHTQDYGCVRKKTLAIQTHVLTEEHVQKHLELGHLCAIVQHLSKGIGVNWMSRQARISVLSRVQTLVKTAKKTPWMIPDACMKFVTQIQPQFFQVHVDQL